MGAIWMRARAELLARWRAWVMLSLILGLGAGASIAAAAGARRTESAYPRFLASQRAIDTLADVRKNGAVLPLKELLAFPQVRDASQAALIEARLTTPSGGVIHFPEAFPIATPDGLFGVELDRVKLIDGRYADQSKPEEIVVGFRVARSSGVKVGDNLPLTAFTDPTAQHTADVVRSVRVVGIGVIPGELHALAGASMPVVLFTQAFAQGFVDGGGVMEPVYAMRMNGGESSIESFQRDAEAKGIDVAAFFRQSSQTQTVTRSVRVQTVALWLVGAFAALATAALLWQAFARQSLLEAQDYPLLRAIGLAPSGLLLAGLLRAAAVAVPALIIATAVAVAASPLAPVGLVRVAETSPGVKVDVLAIGLGLIAILVVVVSASLVSHLRTIRATSRYGDQFTGSRARPSAIVGLLTRAPRSPAALTGVRLALEPGSGRSAVPVRSALVGSVIALGIVSASLVFRSSMDHLIGDPALSGWTFDAVVQSQAEGGQAAFAQQLRTEPEVQRVSLGAVPSYQLGGGKVVIDNALALPLDITPAIAEGRAPRTEIEAALGRDTMDELGLELGDTFDASTGSFDVATGQPVRHPPVTFTLVGRMIMPFLGGNLGKASEGMSTTAEGYVRASEGGRLDAVYVKLKPGVDPDVFRDRVTKLSASSFVSARRPGSGADDIAHVFGVPLALIALVLAIALGTLGHVIVTSVRRRRHDFAILRTMGFVRSQVTTTIAWTASAQLILALLFGIPIGIIAARWGWTAFADAIGVVAIPVASSTSIAVAAAGVLIAGNVLGLVLARPAARTPPAEVLRTE
jgi:hypothetical protein